MWQLMVDYFGDRKVPVVLVVLVIGGLWMTHQWADGHYMPYAMAEANDKALSAKIDENTKLIKTHINQYKINENKKAIALVQDQQFNLSQFISVNGESELTQRRANELDRKLRDLEEQRQCLIAGRPNCER